MASKKDSESEIKKKLAKLPGRNKQCDVVLQIGEDSFLDRKDVLMLRMGYFRDMFNGDMQEKDKAFIKLDPAIVDPAVLDDILEYVYTLNFTLTTTNLEPLYRAAEFFRFDELKTAIENSMKNNTTMNNVACFMDFAVKHNLKSKKEYKKFITSNPLLSSKARRTVGHLNFTELFTLLQKQSSLSMFEEMFHSSIEWILHDEKTRSKKVLELLQKIPLGQLSFHFCKQIISKNNIVKNDIKCLQLLFESAIETHPVEELYVFGGKDGTHLSSMSTYDSSTRQWFGLAPMPSQLTHFAYCVTNQKIYVCGGWNGKKNMNELFMFDRNTHQWSTLKAMKHPRQGCAMALLDGHLYVAGGSENNGKELSVVERYSIQNDEWEDVSPMINGRYGLELVQVNGLLYAIGGQEGTEVLKVLKSAEQFDPQTGEWTALADMNYHHVQFGSAVLNDRVYIVGRNDCEEYDPQGDKWRIMASPTKCGHGRRSVVFDGKLYAIGGLVGEEKNWKGIKTVEYYDFQKRSWNPANDMNIARCFHGVAVITRTYTHE